ncbi:MAG: hypothetical protein O7C69_01740, partial [Gammaproteobacteria bacterium]|nr:hypothetical protein [Gammaproteobacteria bacterium]
MASRAQHRLASTCLVTVLLSLLAVIPGWSPASEGEKPQAVEYPFYPPAPRLQSQDAARAKSAGCVSCHESTDAATMHSSDAVVLGCTDCHGGLATVHRPQGTAPKTAAYDEVMRRAHVQALYPASWHYPDSANPERSYALLNHESPEFIRFVNPSDYRVASEACGACHQPLIDANVRSLMATGAMFWGG